MSLPQRYAWSSSVGASASETVEKGAARANSGKSFLSRENSRECETEIQPERSMGCFTVNRWMLKKRMGAHLPRRDFLVAIQFVRICHAVEELENGS